MLVEYMNHMINECRRTLNTNVAVFKMCVTVSLVHAVCVGGLADFSWLRQTCCGSILTGNTMYPAQGGLAGSSK